MLSNVFSGWVLRVSISTALVTGSPTCRRLACSFNRPHLSLDRSDADLSRWDFDTTANERLYEPRCQAPCSSNDARGRPTPVTLLIYWSSRQQQTSSTFRSVPFLNVVTLFFVDAPLYVIKSIQQTCSLLEPGGILMIWDLCCVPRPGGAGI
jgi:hypothetical protein